MTISNSDDHEIRVTDKRKVEQVMKFTGKALVEGEITRAETLPKSIRTFNCSCGKEDMSYQDALSHIQKQNSEVRPETFKNIAHKLYKGEEIPTGTRQNGFVLSGAYPDNDIARSPLQRGVLVGLDKGERHIVALMKKGTETRGRNEPRMKTRRQTYVKASFYDVNLSEYSLNTEEIGQACIDRGKKIDSGYVNGYRVTPIKDVLDEMFKYYAP